MALPSSMNLCMVSSSKSDASQEDHSQSAAYKCSHCCTDGKALIVPLIGTSFDTQRY
eukprot:m.229791 g.229791  ORF g.229791 m.229791 type:complete len:57 (+) comp17056_c7_seq4:191-361(+)